MLRDEVAYSKTWRVLSVKLVRMHDTKKKDGVNDAQAVTYGQLSKQQSSFVVSFSGIILNIPNGEAAGSAGL